MTDDAARQARDSQDPENTDGEPPALTLGQMGAIRALLGQVARVMERYEIARGAPLEERLSYVVGDEPLTGTERQQLDPLMLELTRASNALARRAVVAPLRRDIRATLRGEFTVLWSDAEDTAVRRLGAYGPVSAEAREALGPAISRLIHATEALLAAGAQTPSPPRAADAS